MNTILQAALKAISMHGVYKPPCIDEITECKIIFREESILDWIEYHVLIKTKDNTHYSVIYHQLAEPACIVIAEKPIDVIKFWMLPNSNGKGKVL